MGKKQSKPYRLLCLACGKRFRSRDEFGKYCSHKCRQAAYRRRLELKRAQYCAWCHQPYKAQTSMSRFCSTSCRCKSWRFERRGPDKIATCLNCGQTFYRSRVTKLYCCVPCRTQADKKRHPEREKQHKPPMHYGEPPPLVNSHEGYHYEYPYWVPDD